VKGNLGDEGAKDYDPATNVKGRRRRRRKGW